MKNKSIKTLSFKLFIAMVTMAMATAVNAERQSIMITVAKGFGLSLYASDLGDAKQMAMGDNGTLFVGSYKAGAIHALVDSNADGRVDKRYIVAKDLHHPEALAFHDGDLYVAEGSRIIRYADIENRMRRPNRGKEVYNRLPGKTNKSRRAMRFGPDGRLYVAIGAPCNVCEAPAPFGSIIAIDVNSGSSQQVATGLRNVTGFDWAPDDNKLWFADIGRDWMGDRFPPDEINRVDTVGSHYGFPYIHATDVEEPAYEKPKGLKVIAPVFELPAHVAPMGLQFYRGQQFPAKYHEQMFVAENGSWNRSSKIGYQVTMLTLAGDKIVERQTVVSFLDGEFPVARPYGLLSAPDGTIYISDDFKGNVYRLFYKDDGVNESEPSEQQDPN